MSKDQIAADQPQYHALVSTDWNQCLAPCGPFDCILFAYPHLQDALTAVFEQYTANQLSLGTALVQVRSLLPAPIGPDEMDAYLNANFKTYTGVVELMQWCAAQGILLMINTTGMVGYFQRALAKGLLPPIPVLSANSTIRFPARPSDPSIVVDLHEIDDKAKNTAALMCRCHIPAERLVLMGDSGGDGPHFKWGAQQGAKLIGSMTKSSLTAFCANNGVDLDLRWGPTYGPGAKPRLEEEMRVDFRQLIGPLESFLGSSP